MTVAATYQKIKSSVQVYQQVLDETADTSFERKPLNGGWSRSEVFWHIFDASLLSLQTALDCARGDGKKRETPFISKLILFFGALPPGRYKMPGMLAERSRSCSPAEARLLINRFLKALDEALPQLKRAPADIKTKHPRLGYFNAAQWLRFMWIHLRHHQKQLLRIERSIAMEAGRKKNL
ncbi:DinB family protein [Pedobacter sp. SYP-B3415]|uniref:DinB family protein n=1 Tax=Pedobacter sp. SYP-B3415 TaxID=2496641 RepID=UPI00101CEECE|nr:DinB family protein [Pedobacter sp. SYP-B3415]